MSEEDHDRGFEQGWEEADAFVDRHPHGMPWVALPEEEDGEEPGDDFERGKQEGWRARMEEEGWPLSRATPEG